MSDGAKSDDIEAVRAAMPRCGTCVWFEPHTAGGKQDAVRAGLGLCVVRADVYRDRWENNRCGEHTGVDAVFRSGE